MEVNSQVATPNRLAAKDALRIVQNDDSKGTSYWDYSRHQCGCSHSHRLTHSRMYKLIIEGSLRRFPEDKQ
jgi:hypothetical protein